MNKLYKAVLLTKNEYDYLQVRFCNDLKSRKERLVRDKYTIISEFEHTEQIDKAYLCELLLAGSTFANDEEYDAVANAKDRLLQQQKKIVRKQNLSNTTVQNVLDAVAV
jgi:hypothetical protein